MCEYQIIKLPYSNKRFSEMNKKELDEYYEWFLDQIPKRINILEQAVNSTSGFAHWKADYSPDSLDRLGEWFEKNVETRLRTDKEKYQQTVGLSWPANQLPIPDWELTHKTYSLAIDIGMYFSQVLLKNIPGIKWEHKTIGSKRWVDYGQPVLSEFDGGVFNAPRIMVSLAYSLAQNTKTGKELREIFKLLKKQANSNS